MNLSSAIQNARYTLKELLPVYRDGGLTAPHHPHGIAVLFRQIGVCRLLNEGVAEPLFVGQMQAVSAYLHRLPTMPEADRVTSRAAVFWDAIGGGYWEAAADIARQSRPTVNPTWEHEDDFLHVWFLMNRYCLRKTADTRAQRVLLDRWDVVLEGAHDPRRAICEALLRGDSMAFAAAFDAAADAREEELSRKVESLALSEEMALWTFPFWGEGLALLRLAERDGLVTDEHCRMVPQVTRATNPFAYDANAWRHLDATPRRSRRSSSGEPGDQD